MANNHTDTEKRLWDAADEFRANSQLKSSEYAVPALGPIFLRYADHRFTIAEKELVGKGSGRRKIGKEDYQAKGVMFVPLEARFSHLLSLPEVENTGKPAGAIMPNLNIGIMESVPILLPPKKVQVSYECLAMENLELVSTLVSKIPKSPHHA